MIRLRPTIQLLVLSAAWAASGRAAVSTGLLSAPVNQTFGSVGIQNATPARLTFGYTFSGTIAPTFSLAYGAEFSLLSTACSGTGQISCTLQVSFAPHAPGLRQDAVFAKDGSGNLLATTLLSGVGLGPQISMFPGTIGTFAGSGKFGYAGDGGVPTAASLSNPQGVAIDNYGNLFIADSVNQVVREVSAVTGRISTVAGTPFLAGSTDNVPATKGALFTPVAVAVDGAGNLFIADSGNNAIRRVDAISHLITTVAGGGTVPSQPDGLGDGGPATVAILNGPNDIAVDGTGNLYIADAYDNLVRKVTVATGIITVVAGGGRNNGSDGLGDGGPALQASLNNPSAIALDAAGNLFIADTNNSLVRRVDAVTQVITVVAGTGFSGYGGDLGPALNARIAAPAGLRLDSAGNLYIADRGKNVIRQVDAASGVITTLAGTTQGGYSGDGGPATAATLRGPAGLAIDRAGNLFVADFGNNAVREISLITAQIAFPNTLLGQASAPQVISVMNTGNQNLTFSGLLLPANFVQQPYAFDCSATTVLAPGAACNLALEFVPGKTGMLSGTLSLTTNALNGAGTTQTIVLTGTASSGAVPQITLSASSLNFASQGINSASAAQSVLVANTGSAPLQLSSVTLAGNNAGEFSLASTCQTSVAAGSSCSISLIFKPTAAGTRTAAVSIVANVANSPLSVALSGAGAGLPQATFSPAAISFGSVSIGGAAATQSVTLSNTGSGPFGISAVSLGGRNAGDFKLNNACGFTLAAAASCSLSIGFAPQAIGLRTAILTVAGNVPGGSVSVAVKGFGSKQAAPTVWRPNGYWFTTKPYNPQGSQWGLPGDIPIPADYDGDGKIDYAIWRPSTGTWYIVPSTTQQYYTVQWGLPGDIPLAADFDGDGKADLAVWRPGNGTWFIVPSTTHQYYTVQWGLTGDIPLAADFDGDGKADLAVWRPGSGTWFIVPSTTQQFYAVQWGLTGDVPLAADFDGDGKADLVVWRPNSGMWFITPSSTLRSYAVQWGWPGDTPMAADFDGDGKADLVVFRPAGANWFVTPSGNSQPYTVQWGLPGDTPVAMSPGL